MVQEILCTFVFAKRKFNFYIAMSKNKSGAFQGLQFRALMSRACVKNVLLLLVLSLASAGLKAQDILLFKNLEKKEVTVLSADARQISYKMYGDDSDEVKVAKASELLYVRYENGKIHRFSDKDENYSFTGTVAGAPRKLTCQLDFLFQDAWGVGLMLRRELNPHFGLNIAGASYISGWHQYEGPSNMGFINVRALGVRFYTPKVEPCRLYAEITPGYTHTYVDVRIPGLGWLKGTGDNFSFDAGAGIEIGKHVALGYHFYYIVGSDTKDGYMHMGKLSILF